MMIDSEKKQTKKLSLLVNGIIVSVRSPARNDVDDHNHSYHQNDARQYNYGDGPVRPAVVQLAVPIRWLETR